MKRTYVETLVVSAVLAVACGDSGNDDGADASGEGTAATESDTTGGSSTFTTSGSESMTGGSGTGGLCGGYDDEAVGPAVTITLRNALQVPAFVEVASYCYFSLPYALVGPDQNPVPIIGPDCGTCQSAIAGNCECPGAPCESHDFLYIEAGAEWSSTWSGGIFVGETLPEACVADGFCPAECLRAAQAADGIYSFASSAATQATGCVDTPCSCEVGPDGYCFVAGDSGMLEGEPIQAGATLDYSSETSVEIVIQ